MKNLLNNIGKFLLKTASVIIAVVAIFMFTSLFAAFFTHGIF